MANFSTETEVREKFQLMDTTLVPSSLVTRGLDDAHTQILRHLDPEFDVPSPESAVVMGETLLAGSNVLRSLASGDAYQQKTLNLSGHSVNSGDRFRDLSFAADVAEEQAWYVLEPYVLGKPAPRVADVTETVPVLEEE